MADEPTLTDPDVLRLAKHLPDTYCDACLGRCFARLATGTENDERGRTIRQELGTAAVDMADCELCEGIADRIDGYEALALEAAEGYEFDTFLVGSKFFQEVVARQEDLWARLRTADDGRLTARLAGPPGGAPPWPAAEWLKNEVNRRVGRRLDTRWGDRTVAFDRPDAVFTVDTRVDWVTLETNPVHLKGRYRKLVRDIPQTRWPCRACGGAGCRACGGRGYLYPTSVEEETAVPAMQAFGAEASAFHGMGREDIDARMLGPGRPFVLELKHPRRRATDLDALTRRINEAAKGRVEVEGLADAEPGTAAEYKQADPAKTYRAACRTETPVPEENLLKAVRSLVGSRLAQTTPGRVAHRRADKVRNRRVRDVRLLRHNGDRFDLEIEADSGTYIKEFVSGDDGRTTPSLHERLGVPVRVEELDVVDVLWEE